jgi:hypothetical protein
MNTLGEASPRLAVFALVLVSCTADNLPTPALPRNALTPFNVTETPPMAQAGQTSEPPAITPTDDPLAPIPIEPVFTIGGRYFGGINWSPDGNWIAYSMLESPADLHILNLVTLQACSLTVPIAQYGSAGDYIDWQADNRLIVIRDGVVTIEEPCAGDQQDISDRFAGRATAIGAASSDRHCFLIDMDEGAAIYDSESGSVLELPVSTGAWSSWSPDNAHVAVRGPIIGSEDAFASTTWVIEAETGRIAAQVKESFAVYEGSNHVAVWVGNTQVLIRETRYTGPLLLSLEGEVTDVRALYGMEPLAPECASTPCPGRSSIATASAQADGDYHLNGPGLYHSDTGEVEHFSASTGFYFSPDGEWMLLHEAAAPDSTDLRAVDPPDSQRVTLGDWQYDGGCWQPDSTGIILRQQHIIGLFTVPGGALIRQWDTTDQGIFGCWWSPDGERLLLMGKRGEFFIIAMP